LELISRIEGISFLINILTGLKVN